MLVVLGIVVAGAYVVQPDGQGTQSDRSGTDRPETVELDGLTELQVEIDDSNEVISTGDGAVTLSVYLVSGRGVPVEEGTVMLRAGTAHLELPKTATVGECDGCDANEARFSLEAGQYALDEDRNEGTLEIEAIPPSDSEYVDSLANPEIVVVRG